MRGCVAVAADPRDARVVRVEQWLKATLHHTPGESDEAAAQVGAWSYALLAAFGLGVTEVAATAVVLSVVWLLNGLWLGRKQETMAAARPAAIQAV